MQSGRGEDEHGVVKGKPEDLGVEVDGVAGEVAGGPAPVGVLDDETGEGGEGKIAAAGLEQLQSALCEQGSKGNEPGVADLFTSPADC